MGLNTIIKTMTICCGRSSFLLLVLTSYRAIIFCFGLHFFIECFKLAARFKILTCIHLLNLVIHKEKCECASDCTKIFNKTSEWCKTVIWRFYRLVHCWQYKLGRLQFKTKEYTECQQQPESQILRQQWFETVRSRKLKFEMFLYEECPHRVVYLGEFLRKV